jgi:hypothetical protein
MNTTITVLFYIAAIIHCLTSRVIAPYLQAIFNELTADVPATATPTLTVAVTEAPTPVAEPAVVKASRPARRRKSSAKVAA